MKAAEPVSENGLATSLSFCGKLDGLTFVMDVWSLTLREEQIMRILENMLRSIIGPKMDEVTGGGMEERNKNVEDSWHKEIGRK
jgi:hypothetical protein